MIQVYLFRGRHPLYETLVSHPPEGVEYLPKRKPGGTEEYTLYNPSNSMMRQMAAGFYKTVRIPRTVPIFSRCDLVHSSRGFMVVGPRPFVVDIEHVASFLGMDYSRLAQTGSRRRLEKWLASPKCAGILPHCEAARKTLSIVSGRGDLAEKTKVVYPTVDPSQYSFPRKSIDKPNLLFIGEYYWKGGREVLDASLRLAERNDFKLTYISVRVHPPEAIIEKASSRLDLEYHEGPIPRRELIQNVYPATDIFVMPTYLDTFGYVFLEAMACGIPCIGTDHFAIPEIIEDGVTGYLVRSPTKYFDDVGYGHPEIPIRSVDCSGTVADLTARLEELMSSRTLREKMGTEAQRRVTDGKFSIRRRNEGLREVYDWALKA